MLQKIQAEVKAPKGQFNQFGKYKYRSCEDIVEAVKPIIHKHGFALTLTDEIVNIGNRFYVKATARLQDNAGQVFETTAFAREEEFKKGMDSSQITGAASSYARKYALNGLFAIDDTKDADSNNKHETDGPDEGEKQILRNLVYTSTLDSAKREDALQSIELCGDYDRYTAIQHRLESLQPNIDEIVNPSQKDINKHVKRVAR